MKTTITGVKIRIMDVQKSCTFWVFIQNIVICNCRRNERNTSMKPYLSIIVPVYKVEKYIEECIKSILRQTFVDFELIWVDDGSPDNCGKICDIWARKDVRIKVIHQENGGLSAARNAGLKIATGIFIAFVDSDDTIATNMYQVLLEKQQQFNAYIVKCGYTEFIDDRNIKTVNFKRQNVFDNDKIREKLLPLYFQGVLYIIVCNAIYKKDLALKVLFPEGFINEDQYASGMYFYYANRLVVVDDALYFYRQNLDGLSKKVAPLKKPLDKFVCFSMLYEDLCKQGVSYNSIFCKQLRVLIARWMYKTVRSKFFIIHMDKPFYQFILSNLDIRRTLKIMWYKYKGLIVLKK